MANVFQVIVTDAEKAGLAVVHFIEDIPAELQKLFTVTAKLFGNAAVAKAISLAEGWIQTTAAQKAVAVADLVLTDVEHTQMFQWIKDELLRLGVVASLPDAHALAGLAQSWIGRGISFVESVIGGSAAAAGITPLAPTDTAGSTTTAPWPPSAS